MRKLLPFALVLCSALPPFAYSCPDTFFLRPATILLRPDTTIYVTKDTPLIHYPAIRLEWQLLTNGAVTQKGVLPFLNLSSKHATPATIPVKIPSGNDEVFLRLLYRSPTTARSAPLLTRLIPVRPWKGDYSIPPNGDISFTDSGDLFTITSTNAFFQFDKQSGWLLAYKTNNLRLVDDSSGLRPSIWPSSVTQPHLQLFSTSTGSQLVIVRAEYTLPEVSCLLHMSYAINATGDMLVTQFLEADTTRPDTPARPPLPSFGMTWKLSPGIDSATCYAPPADTLPPAIFRTALANIPPTNVRWMTITTADNETIRIAADSSFFILHPDGQQLAILRSAPADPLVFGNYRYSFKMSPVLPIAKHSSSSANPRPAPSRTPHSSTNPRPH